MHLALQLSAALCLAAAGWAADHSHPTSAAEADCCLVATVPVHTLADSLGAYPTAAIDPRSGEAYVAWVSTSAGGETNVLLTRKGAAAPAFDRPVRVNHLPGDAAPNSQAPPQVAVGPEGNVYVLWKNNLPIEGYEWPGGNLRLARSTDGGRSFSPAVSVNDDAAGPPAGHNFHDLAVAPDGSLYCSWIDFRLDRDKPDLRVARSTDQGQSFGPNVVVDTDACPCCRTAIGVAPGGQVYVAWRKVYPGSVRDIALASSADGGRSFTSPVRVHADNWVIEGCPHQGPFLGLDPPGRVWVAWTTGAEGRAGAYWAAAGKDLRFDPPTLLSVGQGSSPFHPSLKTAGPGQVLLACESGGAIYLATRFPDRQQDQYLTRGAFPSLALGGGRLALAWMEGGVVRAYVAPRPGP
ncbi:MAG: exo-alpha-sialidase [Candidatus Handelsmanbacteria bacterium]|nr:exo-alpha-sialidase [Candidatus Handelsmanbacteria bacterium]